MRSFAVGTAVVATLSVGALGKPLSESVQHPGSRLETRFTTPGIAISEAAASQQLALSPHPNPNVFVSPARQRRAQRLGKKLSGKKGYETVNTLFDGVYPVLNVTWLGPKKQPFVSFIDTGSSDTFTVSSSFQCVNITTEVPLPQSGCGFGALYNEKEGSFEKINGLEFNIEYFPELEKLKGDIGYHPLEVGGITVKKQEVAVVDYAAWVGDGTSSGLIGLAYPAITSASYKNGSYAEYDPIFTTMVKNKLVKEAVFTLALNRVPRHTKPSAAAGLMAFGGLVPEHYYIPPFTTVHIEETVGAEGSLTWYSTTHELLYSTKNGKIKSGGKFQSIIDSGTAPNFIPSAAAKDLNAQFEPAAVYNDDLGYWVVDCKAKAPYAAYKIGGKVFPMDPRDMIVRSLNGLPGYENTCFSAFADGGDPSESMIIGEVWQRGYVVVYDVGRSQLHIAPRRPY